MVEPTLRVENVSKTFGSTTVLSGVGIELFPGEVHALLGHNGSGKSTLIKALAGVHRPDPGSSAWFNGSPVSLEDAGGAWRRNVRFIHQDLGLIPTLSAVENLALVRGYETVAGRIAWRRETAKARAAVARFGGRFDVTRPVGTLPRSAQSLVAIARAFEGLDDDAAPVVVLDEPTASLPQREVDRLFSAIRAAVGEGAAVMLVSHRLNDVVALADRTTVLRDGFVVAGGEPGRLSKSELVELLVGGATPSVADPVQRETGAILATFTDINGEVVRDLEIQVHRGSIVGVAGLDGSGREELAGLLHRAGAPGDPGTLRLEVPTRARRGRLLTVGHNPVALVPADRKGQGLIASFRVRENVTLPSLRSVTKAGRLSHRRERSEVRDWIRQLDVRPPDPDGLTSSLSGGNAQKVQIAKALRLDPPVLVADEPTAGVDVAAKAQIYSDLAAVASSGVAVVVVSSDTEELSLLCDRVLVLALGQVLGELHGSQITEDAIHRLTHGAGTRPPEPSPRPSNTGDLP